MKQFCHHLLLVVATLLAAMSSASLKAQITGQLNALDQAHENAFFIMRSDKQSSGVPEGSEWTITFSDTDSLGNRYKSPVTMCVTSDDLNDTTAVDLQLVDSLMFQVPENKMKDDVFEFGDAYFSYIVSTDTFSVIAFDASIMPTKLPLPRVGQLVLCRVTKDPLPFGFVGRVLSLEAEEGNLVMRCERLAYRDLFDRLYLVVSGDVQFDQPADSTSSLAPLRRTGMLFDARNPAPENKDYPLDLSIEPAKLEKYINDYLHPKNEKEKEKVCKIKGSIGIKLNFNVYHSQIWDTFKGVNVETYKYTPTFETNWNTKFEISGSVDRDDARFPFGKFEIRIPSVPGLKLEVDGGLFADLNISSSFGLKYYKKVGTEFKFVYKDDALDDFNITKIDEGGSPSLDGDLTIEGHIWIGGYVEITITEINVIDATLKVYTGPKLSGKIRLADFGLAPSKLDRGEDWKTGSYFTQYDNLSDNTKNNLKFTWGIGIDGHLALHTEFFDFKIGELRKLLKIVGIDPTFDINIAEWQFLPKYHDYTHSTDKGRVYHGVMRATGNMLWNTKLGVRLIPTQEGHPTLSKNFKDINGPVFYCRDVEENSYLFSSTDFKDIRPGVEYKVHPLVIWDNFMGTGKDIDFVPEKEEDRFVAPYTFDIVGSPSTTYTHVTLNGKSDDYAIQDALAGKDIQVCFQFREKEEESGYVGDSELHSEWKPLTSQTFTESVVMPKVDTDYLYCIHAKVDGELDFYSEIGEFTSPNPKRPIMMNPRNEDISYESAILVGEMSDYLMTLLKMGNSLNYEIGFEYTKDNKNKDPNPDHYVWKSYTPMSYFTAQFNGNKFQQKVDGLEPDTHYLVRCYLYDKQTQEKFVSTHRWLTTHNPFYVNLETEWVGWFDAMQKLEVNETLQKYARNNPGKYKAVVKWGEKENDLDNTAVVTDLTTTGQEVLFERLLSNTQYFYTAKLVIDDKDDGDYYGSYRLTTLNAYTPTLHPATDISENSAKLSCSVMQELIDEGVKKYGANVEVIFYWSSSREAVEKTLKGHSSDVMKVRSNRDFEVEATNLKENTTYYYTAYVISGITGYVLGEPVKTGTFKTLSPYEPLAVYAEMTPKGLSFEAAVYKKAFDKIMAGELDMTMLTRFAENKADLKDPKKRNEIAMTWREFKKDVGDLSSYSFCDTIPELNLGHTYYYQAVSIVDGKEYTLDGDEPETISTPTITLHTDDPTNVKDVVNMTGSLTSSMPDHLRQYASHIHCGFEYWVDNSELTGSVENEDTYYEQDATLDPSSLTFKAENVYVPSGDEEALDYFVASVVTLDTYDPSTGEGRYVGDTKSFTAYYYDSGIIVWVAPRYRDARGRWQRTELPEHVKKLLRKRE